MIRNINQQSIILRKRFKLSILINYNQQNCYNFTSNVEFLIIDETKIIKQYQRSF